MNIFAARNKYTHSHQDMFCLHFHYYYYYYHSFRFSLSTTQKKDIFTIPLADKCPSNMQKKAKKKNENKTKTKNENKMLRWCTWSELIYLDLLPSLPHDMTMYFFRLCRTYPLSSCVYRISHCFHSICTFWDRLLQPHSTYIHSLPFNSVLPCNFIFYSLFHMHLSVCVLGCSWKKKIIKKKYQRINLAFN